MKKFIKILSVIMAVVMLAQIVLVPVSAAPIPISTKAQVKRMLNSLTPVPDGKGALEPITEEEAAAAATSEITTEDRTSTNPTLIIGEVESLREENSKHYRHEDGTYTAALYAEPVHYKAANGKWQEIDNTLSLNNSKRSAAGKATYTPSASGTDIRIPQEFGQSQKITVTKKGYTVGLGVSAQNAGVHLEKTASVVAVDKLASHFAGAQAADESKTLNKAKKLSKVEKIKEANSKAIKVKNLSSAVVYEDIFPGADIEYIVTPSKIKENIVVKQAQAKYTYKFNISLGGLIVKPQKDGSIFLFDPADLIETEDNTKIKDGAEPVFVLQASYMYDSAGATSTAVKMTLANNGTLTLTADAAWINGENRVFPVVIDPTIINMYTTSFQDAYISTALKGHNYNNMIFNYAGNGLLGTRRTYLKFALPTLPDGSVMIVAALGLMQSTCDYYSAGKHMYLFDLTGKPSWQVSEVTWNNQPVSQDVNGPKNDGTKIADYTPVVSGIGGYLFNITTTVRNWYENSNSNNGFMITTSDESSNTQASLYGACSTTPGCQPVLAIAYNTNIGIEDYWSYNTIDLGHSGTAYVNNYNGSLSYLHNDLAMTGNLMPINLSHVYNSNCYSDNPNFSTVYSHYYSGMNTGKKFHLNIQELLIPILTSDSLYDEGYRFIHYDSDGTMHYYLYNGLEVTHEYDEKLKVTTEGNNHIITDSQGNIKHFNSAGQLFMIEDNNGNTQTYTFSGNKITQITDGAGRTVDLNYNDYNQLISIDQLISITDPTERSTTFTYSSTASGANLTSITYPNSNTTSFMYTTNSHISRITAENNNYATFSYVTTTGCGRRVSHAYQYTPGTPDIQVDHLQFQYIATNSAGDATSNTVVTNKNGKSNRFLFDWYGRASHITNQDGQSQHCVYGDDVGNSFNKMFDKSELQTISTNLLKNHGFESNGNWQYVPDTGGQLGYSTDFSSKGLRSMKMSDSSQNSWNHVLQEFVAEPGETYTLSADFYIPNNETQKSLQGDGGIRMGFTYYDTDDNWHHELAEPIKSTSGWERHSFTFTYPENAVEGDSNFAAISLAGASGEFYFDNVQLEKSGGSRNYNLLENGNFSYGTGTNTSPWVMTGTSSPDGVYLNASTGCNELRIGGSLNASKVITQTVRVNAKKDDTIIIGGQAWGNSSIGADGEREFGVIAKIYSTDTDTDPETIELNFNLTSPNASLSVAKYLKLEKDCYKVDYSFVYSKILGDAVFENSFIYVGNFGEHYTYDDEGQLEKVTNDDGDQLTNYNYNDDNDLVSVEQTISGEEITVANYEYDNNHNVTKAVNNIGTQIVTVHNTNGLVTSQTITEATVSTTETMEYTTDGNYLKTYTDANGVATHYEYDNPATTVSPLIGLVTKVTDSKNNITLYTYDPDTDELLSTSGNNGSSETSFTTQDYLPEEITRNNTTYTYEYDSQNRVTAAKVGNQALSSITYDSRQRLQAQTYANGAVYKPEYDSRDRLIGEKWGVNGVVPSVSSPLSIKYFYNENDRLSKVDDYESGVSYHYDYAFSGLLHRTTGSDGTKTEYDYDMSGKMSHLTFSKNDETIYKARYVTDEKGNPADVILGDPLDDVNDDIALHYNYDGFSRLKGRSVGPLLNTHNYTAGTGENTTTNLVSEYANENGDGVALQRYGYEYDLNGNITKITDAVTGKTTEYTYDGLNRLESETINNVTTEYTYDAGGNLNTVTQGSTVTNYTYSTGDWKDQLTYFDGKPITYDAQGNPLTYDGYTFGWQRGTQLAGITGNNKVISYAYDGSGLRTSKNVNGITTSYLYSGDLLMRQQTGSDILDFSYDADGTAIGFKHNGTLYYYLRNLQNDVVGITNADGNVIAEYSYDAWGNAVASGTSDITSLETKWLPRFMGAVGLSGDESEALTSGITALGIEEKANLQAYIEAYFTAQGTTPSTNISTWIDSTLADMKDFLRSSEFCNYLVNGNIEEIKSAFDTQDTVSVPFCAYFAGIADGLRTSVADVLESDTEDQYNLYSINSMVRDIMRFYLFLLTGGTTILESDVAALLTLTKEPADIRDSQSARSALYAMLGLDLPEEDMNALMQKVTELKIYDPESLRAYCEDMNMNSEDVDGWLQNMRISLMSPKKLDNIWSFILASALTDPAELEDNPPALYFSNILDSLKALIGETLTTVPELELGGLRVSEMDADTAFAAAILLGELVVMNMDAGAVMLLVDILNPESESVTELAAQYAAVAALNPIRYRGYYYDAETGYYFLNTRYYNPEWRRFLNADALFVAGSDAINGSNMYAYCNGNPVMYSDPSGMAPSFIELLKGAFEGFVSDKVSQAASGVFGRWFGPKIGWITDKTEYLIGAIVNTRGRYWFTPWQEKEYNGERDLRTDYNDTPIINLFIKEDMRTNIITEALSGLTGLDITLTDIGAYLLDFHMDRNRYSPNYGNYRSLPGSYQWQKHVGYTWWYDWFFDLGGPIERKIYQFEVQDTVLGIPRVTQYIVWCWKADYWNLGAGAEIGIYYQDDPVRAAMGYFEIDTDNLLVHALMNVDYYGDDGNAPVDHIITNFNETNWWVCMFVPRVQSANVNYLDVHLKVAFAGKWRHKDLMKPFYKEGVVRKIQGSWQEIEWSDTATKLFRVPCGEHPSQCTCKLFGIIPSPCKYYSDIDMYNLSGWQFEIRY